MPLLFLYRLLTANVNRPYVLPFGVSGMLQSRSYEKDGNRVYVTEILVENFDLLEKKDKGSEVVPVFETVDIKDEDLPF